MSGAKLLFYDLRGEDAKIQVMANAKYVLLLVCLSFGVFINNNNNDDDVAVIRVGSEEANQQFIVKFDTRSLFFLLGVIGKGELT